MGAIFQKTVTRLMPAGAEVFIRAGQRFARWKINGKSRTAKLTTGRDGSERIVTESPTYLAKFRDGSGIVGEVSTGGRDEGAARSVLGELEKRAEEVRSGIISTAENLMATHQHTLLTEHLAEFIATMQAAGRSEIHVSGTERLIQRVIDELNLRRLSDIQVEAIERWLAQQAKTQPDKAAMGARTRNS